LYFLIALFSYSAFKAASVFYIKSVVINFTSLYFTKVVMYRLVTTVSETSLT